MIQVILPFSFSEVFKWDIMNSFIEVSRLIPSDFGELKVFCEESEKLGVSNNASFKAMKLGQLDNQTLAYWILKRGRRILGISGCQSLPQFGPEYFRVLFRSCVLPGVGFRNSLAKTSVASSPLWRLVLPEQLDWARGLGGEKFLISVNLPVAGQKLPRSMEKVSRVLSYMCKNDLLELWRENEILYGTAQDIYLLKEERFRESHEFRDDQ